MRDCARGGSRISQICIVSRSTRLSVVKCRLLSFLSPHFSWTTRVAMSAEHGRHCCGRHQTAHFAWSEGGLHSCLALLGAWVHSCQPTARQRVPAGSARGVERAIACSRDICIVQLVLTRFKVWTSSGAESARASGRILVVPTGLSRSGTSDRLGAGHRAVGMTSPSSLPQSVKSFDWPDPNPFPARIERASGDGRQVPAVLSSNMMMLQGIVVKRW